MSDEPYPVTPPRYPIFALFGRAGMLTYVRPSSEVLLILLPLCETRYTNLDCAHRATTVPSKPDPLSFQRVTWSILKCASRTITDSSTSSLSISQGTVLSFLQRRW